MLAGKDNYEVCLKEGNCKFEFDIRKVYWCSKLATERDRMLKEIKPGEVLCDAFCGIGPLSVRLAKQDFSNCESYNNKTNKEVKIKESNFNQKNKEAKKKTNKVLANDLNPDCYYYLTKNVKLNKLNEKDDDVNIYCFNMDAREFIKSCINQLKSNSSQEEESNFDGKFPNKPLKVDIIYMNLPKDALEFLDVFKGLFNGCKPEFYEKGKNNLPIVYVYCFAKEISAKQEIIERMRKSLDYEGFNESHIIKIHNIKDVSPKKFMFCVSFRIPEEIGFYKSN